MRAGPAERNSGEIPADVTADGEDDEREDALASVGRTGAHKLAPVISPKKTWEGLAGSVLACVVAGAILLPALLHGHWWQGIIIGVAAVAAAVLGDLAESMIKRDLDIKDMGSLLPGHGGILDRIDSLIICAPVVWLLLALFLHK